MFRKSSNSHEKLGANICFLKLKLSEENEREITKQITKFS